MDVQTNTDFYAELRKILPQLPAVDVCISLMIHMEPGSLPRITTRTYMANNPAVPKLQRFEIRPVEGGEHTKTFGLEVE